MTRLGEGAVLGAMAAVIAPRREEGHTIDISQALDIVDFVNERGVKGIAVLGATGEFIHYDVEERMRLAQMAVRRAISNLIDNALRYSSTPVEIEARREGGFAVIEVRDRGPGIPASEAERMKRPFTRLEAARSDAGGSGLGLAIVDRVARMHGGRLDLLPREGGGLVARLLLSTAGRDPRPPDA